MRIEYNVSLKPYNTFGIDATAARMLHIESDADLEHLRIAEPYLVLGRGSNVVFTADYPGTVVVFDTGGMVCEKVGDQMSVTADAGALWDDLVEFSIAAGAYGLENLSAIPGTVGASAVQNVGAYGREAKDFIDRVYAYDLQNGQFCEFSNAECAFAYRDSLFKQAAGRYLVYKVRYRLSPLFNPFLGYRALDALPHATAQELRQAITGLRWSKLPRPEETGSAGSFFKNPVVDEAACRRLQERFPDMPAFLLDGASRGYKLSAAWLIDRCGWKGRTMGRAGVYANHALVLVNLGGCTGAEVKALADAIAADVRRQFGVTLIPEAIII